MSPWAVAPGTTAGEHAAAILAARETRATVLGEALAGEIGDPAAFAVQLSAAFAELADPEYRAGQAYVAPGIGPTHGVRTPLQVAVRKGFERASRRASPAELLLVCDRLLHEPEREARWFAISTLQRTLPAEPERTWQLLRRAAAEADDWITIDDLAHPYGKGILAEPYRWAELEQLTVSPSRWERRLVGSTIATMPFVNRRLGRSPEVAARHSPSWPRSSATPSPTSRRHSRGPIDPWPSSTSRQRPPPSSVKRRPPRRKTTGIGRGSSATACPSSSRRMPRAFAIGWRRFAAGPERRRPPRQPSWRAASPAWGSGDRCPTHRSPNRS